MDVLSASGRQQHMNAKHMKTDPELLRALHAAEAIPDDQIITDEDAPEIHDWSHAQRGRFYRPRKIQKIVRFDADILAFLKKTDRVTRQE